MTATLVRLAVAAWILVTLARAGRAAWSQRALVRAIWRRIRPRHLAGSVVLLGVVVVVAVGLLTAVPVTRFGLGSLVGVSGNAVFVPLEEAVSRAPAAAAGGPDWPLMVLSTLFLGLLAALLPWLAFVEEEIFRAGLEDASLGREAVAALTFGLAHLVMLVPIAAALAIAVAGFLYGRAYRRAYAAHAGGPPPTAAARAFRPTRRSRAAASRTLAARAPGGPGALVDPLELAVEHRQTTGVLASTVWHTTFNSLVVVVVWVMILVEAW